MKRRLSRISITSKNTIKGILFAALFVSVFSQIAFADDRNAVKNLLQDRFDQLIAILKNRDNDDESKKGKIEDIIKPIFDFPLMSKLALGREPWTAMSKEDRKKFSVLFTKKLKQDYLSKILSYVDEDIIIEEPVQDGKKVSIPTFIVSKEKKISVLYKFYQSGSGWKIYDIEAEGISYIQSYRSQFTESLKEMTVQELMIKMENLISSQ